MPELTHKYRVSIVVPVFNEQLTLPRVVEQIRATGLAAEIILVNDGSTDGTQAICEGLAVAPDVQSFMHAQNRGKGAALKTGFSHVTGDFVVVQDADLEYDPGEIRELLAPLLADQADVVYGSRYVRPADRDADGWHYRANWLITCLSNLTTGWKLSDVETCYKLMRRSLVERMTPLLCEQRFGIEIELTARLAAMKARVVELPITYQPRSRNEGKKIGWKDGLWALVCIARYANVKQVDTAPIGPH